MADPRPDGVVAEGIQQRPELGWGQLLGRVMFWLVVDVLVGCGVYFLSCGGKECKDRFSGVTGNTFADALYFSSTTLTTTGFGDIAPTAPASKALTSLYIVSNTFYINYFVYPPFVRLVQLVEGRNRGFWRRFVLAICYCLICLLSGIPFLICLGGLGWGNAAYTVLVSFTSTGYGDYTFAKMWGRVFNSLWLLVSHLVNYRLGGLVTDAGDHSFLQDDGARAQAATTAAAAAAANLVLAQQQRDAAYAARDTAYAARDTAYAARDSAREQLCINLVHASYVQAAQEERDAAYAARDTAYAARDTAYAARNSAREQLCIHLVYATWHIQAADARRAAAEERLNQVVEEIDAAVEQTVGNFVLMLTDAYFEVAILEAEKVELGARLRDTRYDLSRLQNPT